MIETVAAVRVLRPFVLEVTFEDGAKRRVDVEPYLNGEIFRPLRDPTFFARARVDAAAGTVVWPNGADFSPEFLYYGEAGPPPGYYDEAEIASEPTVAAVETG
jgi:hypothetical protein